MRRKFKRWWLQRSRIKSNKCYSTYIAEAKGEEQQFRISEAINDRDQRSDQIQSLNSILLIDRAEKFGISIPRLSDTDSWERGQTPGTVYLTLKAQSQLRREILSEREVEWSMTAFVLKDIVTPIAGLIGVIMGLLSLIHSFHLK